MPSAEQSRARAKDERLQAHKVADNQYTVYNPTSKSAYSVLRSVTGNWYCTCPYATKSSRPGACKHLQRVRDKEAGCKDCERTDVKLDGNRQCASCKFYDKIDSQKW